jgi:flavin reductase (DIM6/NTAB) family NADH-FMN oxidoreductase RutF
MIFDVGELATQQKYRLLVGGVTPRPIAWISTRSKDGIDNLAPYSFFTVASCNPPVLLYTQVNPRSNIDKDTLQNIIDTGECVVNIANSDLLEQLNSTSASLSNIASEFDFADVEQCDSAVVTPKSVKAAPIRYECALRQSIVVSDLPTGGTVVLLDVKSIYVHDDLYIDGQIDQTSIDSIGKMGGDFYSRTCSLLETKRPND